LQVIRLKRSGTNDGKLPLTIRSSEFTISVADARKLPPPLRGEFVFVGRSNVGKSSLLNRLLNRKNFARISSRPGKTRLINYFLINEDFYLVDLPGYGFARVSHDEKKRWGARMDHYLRSDRRKLVFQLIDARTGITPLDKTMLEWLAHFELPVLMVVTKIDKLSRSEAGRQVKAIREVALSHGFGDVIPFSAVTGAGVVDLHNEILDFLSDNPSAEEGSTDDSETGPSEPPLSSR
jgi:GTP-binding protein